MRSLTLFLVAVILGCSSKSEETVPPAQSPSAPPPAPQVVARSLPPRTVAVGEVEIAVSLAADELTRGLGLSDRDEVPAGTGMLFAYPSARMRSFWMKGCRVGLDIAYLSDDRRIFQIGSLDPPAPGTTDPAMPRLISEAPARFVLETAKGFMAEAGIKVGQLVRLSDDIEEVVSELR